MSLVPEQWAVIADDGDTVVITRVKMGTPDRITTWKLIRAQMTRDGKRVWDWLVVQVFYSQPNEGLDGNPARLKEYRNGIRLSDSVIDRQLRTLANG